MLPCPRSHGGAGGDGRSDGVGAPSAWTPRGLGAYWLLGCVCVCVCVSGCVCVCVCLHLPLVCEMGSLPHVCELTGMPTHGHTQTQDSVTCHHSCAQVHILLCTETHAVSYTHARAHTRRHASLLHSLFPSRSALPARGTSWPPAPSSILPASLSRVPPYPSHLLISLLNSRRQRGSGRGEMDGPGEGVEGPGRESWGGRSSGLLQPPCQAGAKLSGTGVGRPGR